jgi:hypothetical protein
MMKNIFLISALLLSFHSPKAFAQQAASVMDSNVVKVKIEEVNLYKDQGIPFLAWLRDTFVVESVGGSNYVTVRGQFKEKVINATVNGRTLNRNESGYFAAKLDFTGEEKSFIITVTDANNKIFRMQYKMSQVADKKKIAVGPLPGVVRWRFSAGAGLTLISYRQQDISTYDQKVVTVKAGVVYRLLPGELDLGVNAFYNLVPLSSTSVDGYKIQYMGINVRAGYHILDSDSPLRVTLNGGMYFNNSYGNVGFANMYGPQISPEFVYIFNNGNSLFLYLKYAHSLSGSTGISLNDNREVATGLHYSFPISQSNRLSIGVDMSQLSLSLPDVWASTNTYSLSAGISF